MPTGSPFVAGQVPMVDGAVRASRVRLGDRVDDR